jgi:hypothetical protein
LEKGTIPWRKPWHGNDRLPRNLVSNKEYRGINVFLLHAMAYRLGPVQTKMQNMRHDPLAFLVPRSQAAIYRQFGLPHTEMDGMYSP